jgi:penicillin amidase
MAARKLTRLLLRGSLWLLGAAAFAVTLSLALFIWSSLPQTRGEREIADLAAPVEVLRDEHEIVTIRAANELDAYRALGFVHAQERIWQMDSMRRVGAGRLSEIVGESTLEIDRLMRSLELYREAEKQLKRLSREALAAGEAYAAGVNAYIAQQTILPPEFLALGYEPEPWRPTDSLVWGNLMALQLSGDWRDELLRVRLLRRLSEEQVAFLWPEDRPGDPVTQPAPPAREPDPEAREGALRALEPLPDRALARLEEILPWSLEPKSASNWWVVDGSRSVTGSPILANDPHLALDSPGQWMLVRLEWPGELRVGVTAPGAPFLIVGHNGHLAWGFTTTHSDTQDLFVEQLSADGREVETAEGFVPLEARRETIAVKGAPAVAITVRRSPHGPIISDVLEDEAELIPPDTALSLSWPLYDPENRTAEAFYRIGHAKSAEAFLQALSLVHAPQQNIAFATVSGDIGYIAAGAVPIRPADDGSHPLAGWVAPFSWEARVPYGQLPQSFNPREGQLVSANNRIVGPDYPYLINRSFPDPARAIRIEEMLAANGKLGPTAAAAMQLDVLSITARDLLPLLLPLLSEEQRAGGPAQAMAGWNHLMTRRRVEPTLFAAWARSLMSRLIADETAEAFERLARPDRRLLLRILTEQPDWCDDITSRGVEETCEEQVRLAYRDALTLLTERLGPDWRDWRWERLHRATFPHPIFRHVPLLQDLLTVGTPGWDDTVNRGGSSLGYDDLAGLFRHRHGAGLRVVYDLKDLDNSLFIITPGQSGNILSGGYGNFVERWRDGRSLKLVGAATDEARLLLLNPAQ